MSHAIVQNFYSGATRLCAKDGKEYKHLTTRAYCELIGEFDTPYWAHKWLKTNGYSQTGYYKAGTETIEMWRK